MSPKELTAFRLEPELMDGLRRVKDRDAIPFSIQVDRALRAWLEKKRVSVAKPKTASSTRGKRLARRTKWTSPSMDAVAGATRTQRRSQARTRPTVPRRRQAVQHHRTH